MSRRLNLFNLAKVLILAGAGVGIVVWLLWSNWEKIQAYDLEWSRLRWRFLWCALAVCLLATLLTFLRWSLLVWAQDLPFRLRDGIRIGFIGYFFNQVMPGAVGGDLIKAVLIAYEQQRRTVAIATVVMDRLKRKRRPCTWPVSSDRPLWYSGARWGSRYPTLDLQRSTNDGYR